MVWIERVGMGGAAALIGGDHWVVRVGEDCQDCHEFSKESILMANAIRSITRQGEELHLREGVDGSYFHNQNWTAKDVKGSLTLSGTTIKANEDISVFINQWIYRHKKYDLLGANCQKARDLVQFLVGGSYEPPYPLPQASKAIWKCRAGHFTAKSKNNKFKMSKWTTGKVGGIWHLFGIEMEGPKIAVGAFPQNHFGNWGPFVEASLFRIEAKCVGLHVCLEPNWNTCAGLRDGQFTKKNIYFRFGTFGKCQI